MSNIEYKIIRERELDEYSFLSEMPGCNNNELGLCGWAYEFDVLVTNQKGDTETFRIAYQTEDRNDSLRAYSGYDIETACDDESESLEVFCEYDTFVLDALHVIASKEAKKEYENYDEDLRKH